MNNDITDRLSDLDGYVPSILREAVDTIKTIRQSNTELVASINHLVEVNEALCVQRRDLIKLLARASEALEHYAGGDSFEVKDIQKKLKTFKATANINV